MLTLICFTTIIAISIANPQYPPSGWRPRGTPFVLPREYLPSAPLKSAVQHEINRERLEYIGQYQVREPYIFVQTNFHVPQQAERQVDATQQTKSNEEQVPQVQVQQEVHQLPHTTYLTPAPELLTTTAEPNFEDISTTTEYISTTTDIPTTTDNTNFLRVQGLPSLEQAVQFRDPNSVKVKPINQNNAPQFGQLRQQQQSNFQQFSQQQNTLADNKSNAKFGKQIVQPVLNSYGAPQVSSPPILLRPVNTYGPPVQVDQIPVDEQSPRRDNEESRESIESNESQQQQANNDDSVQSNIAIANAFNNNEQASGQYYLLNKDNLLQRVVFMTTPNQEDNGFTAQIRYMPVEPIRDPIYSYNENGQLVRVFRK